MSNMDVERVVGAFQAQYPDRSIVMRPEVNPTEVLCIIAPTVEHPDYSVTPIRALGESELHKHNGRTEVHTVKEGELTLHLGKQALSLSAGDTCIVRPGTVHWAVAVEEALIHVVSIPGWTREDHIIADLATGEEQIMQQRY